MAGNLKTGRPGLLASRSRRLQRGRQFRSLVLSLVAGLTLVCAGSPPADYQVKAGFLFYFTQFMEWPSNTFETRASPFVIGLVGHDKFAQAAEQAVKGELVHGREITVKRVTGEESARRCHILFIGIDQHFEGWIEMLRGSPVLTVGEVAGFCERGGLVNLVRDGETVRLEIARARAEQLGIKISSRLLDLALLVETDPSGKAGDP
jgi:hypothetical protein